MKANKYRGEIAATIDDCRWTLCLTLGALAELETAFEASDLGKLAQKLSSGSLTAKQMTAILAAGLRGGGHDVSDENVADMRCAGGAAGMAAIVAELLGATFGAGTGENGEPPPNPHPPQEI
jgi:hypothetical protein